MHHIRNLVHTTRCTLVTIKRSKPPKPVRAVDVRDKQDYSAVLRRRPSGHEHLALAGGCILSARMHPQQQQPPPPGERPKSINRDRPAATYLQLNRLSVCYLAVSNYVFSFGCEKASWSNKSMFTHQRLRNCRNPQEKKNIHLRCQLFVCGMDVV